ncbi:hypothetical protein GGS21DRAFT_90690 [Xylaria nigripes]|nr:hypothetical protein GGS21DRAFT_90690 [Xylaria nigripes]
MFAMAYSRYILPLVAIMALISGPQLAEALDMKYCASINTGMDSVTNSSIYQSNGLCHDFCIDKFAFAIVQETNCWCSDLVPEKSAQVATGECNTSCPGWPPDTCGADGLYGYIALGRLPSGTGDGGSSSPTSTGQTSTSTVDTSSVVTSATHSTLSTSLTSIISTPGDSTTTKPTDNGATPTTPNTTVKTVTAGGTVGLETVTVTPIPAGESGDKSSSTQALSAGATAGIAVGAIAGVTVIAVLAIFYHRRKKRELEEELASRSQSHLSGSMGIMSTPTTTMASVWDGENTSGRRSSRMMAHDPRMDPFSTNIYGRFENKSRESINTLQDNQDYSRKVLRTTNPDPPED